MKTARNLPQFVLDLLASVPARGQGLNRWLFRVARVLHPYRNEHEIIETLRAATAGEPVKHGEIERAVERSKSSAWTPGEPSLLPPPPAWPPANLEQREAVVRETQADLVDLWEASPVRFEDGESHSDEVIALIFPGKPLLCCAKLHEAVSRTRNWTCRNREEVFRGISGR